MRVKESFKGLQRNWIQVKQPRPTEFTLSYAKDEDGNDLLEIQEDKEKMQSLIKYFEIELKQVLTSLDG